MELRTWVLYYNTMCDCLLLDDKIMTEIKELEGEVACLAVTSGVIRLHEILNENDNEVGQHDLRKSIETMQAFIERNKWRILNG